MKSVIIVVEKDKNENISHEPIDYLSRSVAVGIAVTGYPPHRSGRALLTHPAPTSGVWRKSAAKDKDAQFGGEVSIYSPADCNEPTSFCAAGFAVSVTSATSASLLPQIDTMLYC